ncbi:MAG TPA: AraC family transcriptional regulator [Thermoanaerobaculia bacterium]
MAVHLGTGQHFGTTTARSEARGVVLSCLRHSVARKLPVHAHEAAFFTMLLRGDYRERNGSREIHYDPLTVVFHPPSHQHLDEIGAADSRMVSVEVRRELFDEYDLPLPPLAPQSFAASRALLGLYRAAREGALTPSDVECVTIELLGDAAKMPHVPDAAPAWLIRVMEMLDELPESPRVADLAREANVHPVHLARVFRRHLRITPGQYLQRRRLRLALRLLGTRPLSDVALASGFADQSHLTRAMRATLGETPRGLAMLLSSR